MRVKSLTIAMLAALEFMAAAAFGDGMTIKDGRYADGPVTVLDLTDDQLVTVKTKRVVVLTKSQKERLAKDTGVAPSVLQVYSLRTATQDCTCGDYNTAIWFAARKIEVLHSFLVSDAEAERMADDREVIE